jgi:hypothetical protein
MMSASPLRRISSASSKVEIPPEVTTGVVNPASFTRNAPALNVGANYVLSAYVWNAGRYDTSGFGGGDLATVKLIDPGDGTKNISLLLESQASNGGAGSNGYFIYIMANQAQTAAWSGVQVQAIGEEGTIGGAIPVKWAQFDNVSLTPSEQFVGNKWTSAAGGPWTTVGSWQGSQVPNAAGAVADQRVAEADHNVVPNRDAGHLRRGRLVVLVGQLKTSRHVPNEVIADKHVGRDAPGARAALIHRPEYEGPAELPIGPRVFQYIPFDYDAPRIFELHQILDQPRPALPAHRTRDVVARDHDIRRHQVRDARIGAAEADDFRRRLEIVVRDLVRPVSVPAPHGLRVEPFRMAVTHRALDDGR